VFPLDTLIPVGFDVTFPPLPLAVTVMFTGELAHVPPHVNVPPHPSGAVPQVTPCAAHVVGVQAEVGLAVTVKTELTVTEPPAVMLTERVPAENDVVVAVNVAEVCPAGTVTVAGTVTRLLLLDRLTFAPPAGAAIFSETVPVLELPLTTLLGLNVSAVGAGTPDPHIFAEPPPPQVSPGVEQPQLITPPQPFDCGPQVGPPEHATGTHPLLIESGAVTGACPAAPELALMLTTAGCGTEASAWTDSTTCDCVQLPRTIGWPF